MDAQLLRAAAVSVGLILLMLAVALFADRPA